MSHKEQSVHWWSNVPQIPQRQVTFWFALSYIIGVGNKDKKNFIERAALKPHYKNKKKDFSANSRAISFR